MKELVKKHPVIFQILLLLIWIVSVHLWYLLYNRYQVQDPVNPLRTLFGLSMHFLFVDIIVVALLFVSLIFALIGIGRIKYSLHYTIIEFVLIILTTCIYVFFQYFMGYLTFIFGSPLSFLYKVYEKALFARDFAAIILVLEIVLFTNRIYRWRKAKRTYDAPDEISGTGE